MEAPGPETLSAPPPPRTWVRLAILFYSGMGLIAWLWRDVWMGRSLLYADAAAAARGIRWAPDGLLGVLAGAAAVLISRWATRHTKAGEGLARVLGAAIGPLALRHCVALALASAAGEEALFRGAIQPSLGLLGASVVFGLAHLAPRRELWPWSLFAFAGGLGLGALFQATGNLVAPVLAHATLNAVNLRFLAREYGVSPARR